MLKGCTVEEAIFRGSVASSDLQDLCVALELRSAPWLARSLFSSREIEYKPPARTGSLYWRHLRSTPIATLSPHPLLYNGTSAEESRTLTEGLDYVYTETYSKLRSRLVSAIDGNLDLLLRRGGCKVTDGISVRGIQIELLNGEVVSIFANSMNSMGIGQLGYEQKRVDESPSFFVVEITAETGNGSTGHAIERVTAVSQALVGLVHPRQI